MRQALSIKMLVHLCCEEKRRKEREEVPENEMDVCAPYIFLRRLWPSSSRQSCGGKAALSC